MELWPGFGEPEAAAGRGEGDLGVSSWHFGVSSALVGSQPVLGVHKPHPNPALHTLGGSCLK